MRERRTMVAGMRRLALWVMALGAGAYSGTVHAQAEVPEQHTEAVRTEVFQEDVTSLNLSLGGSLNTGNTQAYQVDSGGEFRLVRGRHGAGADARFSYGEANLQDDLSDEFQPTVKNFRARARYDYFLTRNDAVFAASAFRWDEFAGLDARVQGQLGYMRNFFAWENHRFWGELGYDITYDDWHQEDGAPPLPQPNQTVHSVRTFVGYNNELNDAVTFVTGLEGLFNVENSSDIRIAWDNALRSKIGGDFQLEMKFSLAWDGEPVPGARELDTTTLVTLIYSMI